MKKSIKSTSTHTHLYQHVDDVTNICASKNRGSINRDIIALATDFADRVKAIGLEISDKTTIVPKDSHSKNIARILRGKGIPIWRPY